MNKWKHTLDVSDIWDQDWNNENIHILGKEITKRIRKLLPDYGNHNKWGFRLLDIVESLENICTLEESKEINEDNKNWSIENDEEYFEIVPLEEFNNWWDEFYNFADSERIWVKRAK